jgi:hypothetical protein
MYASSEAAEWKGDRVMSYLARSGSVLSGPILWVFAFCDLARGLAEAVRRVFGTFSGRFCGKGG